MAFAQRSNKKYGLAASIAANVMLVGAVGYMSMSSSPKLEAAMVTKAASPVTKAIQGVQAVKNTRISRDQGRALLNASPNKATLLKMGAMTNKLQQ
mmetsp:Transcript_1526/g.2947  ORF Transcript_1526/g.2947 Transcript_1526/m.2947 type:complete len:96 (-) Transcript_1526:38-325(-)